MTYSQPTEGERVSVIMPCYNAAAYVAEAIDDVLNQTHREIQLIVVDDGSTDASAEIISGFGPRVTLIRRPNGGVSAARNMGLAQAQGTYVAFLDADDRWDRTFIETMVGALHNSDADLAYCGWARFWGDLSTARPFVPRDIEAQGQDKLSLMLEGCPFPIHSVLVRRTLIEQAGGFNRRFPPAEDYELWLRLAVHHRFRRVPKVMAYYRRHPHQQTANHFHLTKMRWRVLRHFAETHFQHLQHIAPERIEDLVNGVFRREGYAAYWRGDLQTARRCFRCMLWMGQVTPRDMKVALPSLLPMRAHEALRQWRQREQPPVLEPGGRMPAHT